MCVVPIRRQNDLRLSQPKDGRQRAARIEIALQAAIWQTEVRSPIEFQNRRGRVGLGGSAFGRTVRSRLAVREVDHPDSQALLAANENRAADADLRIIGMRGDNQNVKLL